MPKKFIIIKLFRKAQKTDIFNTYTYHYIYFIIYILFIIYML